MPTRLRGLSDAYGSWKTICISRRSGRRRRVPRFWIGVPWKTISPAVGSSSRTIVRPSVDLPQPDSPTSPSVSPSLTAKLTSSTACTCATSRCSSPFRIGKYFLTCLTSRSGVSPDSLASLEDGHAAAAEPPEIVSSRWSRLNSTSSQQRSRCPGVPTRFSSAGFLLALLERVRAARPELAAFRQVDERGRAALDRVQALGPRPVETRDRAEQAPRVRHLRVVEDIPLRTALDDTAGVHDDDLVCDFRDHAEVVRDEDDGRVEVVFEAVDEIDDLRLDRHVERGRRLVGDQDRRVARQRHRDHRALPHPARELMREVVDARLRIRDSDLAQKLDRARPRRPLVRRARAPGSPRRSGRRSCRPGFSEVIGSWKIIPSSFPR